MPPAGILGNAGLALDPADGTLWTSNGSNTLFQFSQAGTMLAAVPYAINGSFYGMEFATTPAPEPAAIAMLGVGFAIMLRRRSA